MLNTTKLLYILPDVTYLAELLPGKKANSFVISNFRQINGQFIDEDSFIIENIKKLVSKLDKDSYRLILPDFLFTNTIVNVEESSESKVKQYLKEKLLPDLSLSLDTHQIETSILTEHKGAYKVQISAIEKSVLLPLKNAAEENGIKIKDLTSLSWTVKSVISLEPSLSLIQMGEKLYLALHYIGLDQSESVKLSDAKNLIETVKTLKGSEASIQTLYLVSSALIEDKIKDDLNKVLPVQQLADLKDDEAKLPSYIKTIIESGMKSLSVKDYQLPFFALDKRVAGEVSTEEPVEEEPETAAEASADLPKPKSDLESEETKEKAEEKEDEESQPEEEAEAKDDSEATAETEAETEKKEAEEPSESTEKEEAISESKEEEKSVESAIKSSQEESKETSQVATKEEETKVESKSKESDFEEIDLSQFAKDTDGSKKKESPVGNLNKEVIKNKNGVSSMLKMIFIALASFSITIAIGVGIGLGIWSLSNRNKGEVTSPIVEEPVAETPSPTPTEEPKAELNKEEIKILVVNATTTSGYAGKYKKVLEDAGYKKISTGNAKGDYEKGFYLLSAEEDKNTLTVLAEDLDLDLSYSAKVEVEDSKKEYDLVIVLADTAKQTSTDDESSSKADETKIQETNEET